MNKRVASALFCLMLFGAPTLAVAHSQLKGIHSFYDGLLHPVLVPAHLLLLVATGLCFGQRGLRKNESALKIFFATVVLGLTAAWFSRGGRLDLVILAGAGAIGLVVAASVSLPWYGYAVIGAMSGLSLGFDSAQGGLSGMEKFESLAGSGVGIAFFSMYPMAFAEYLQARPWQRVGVRVFGSWITASSLLVLALSVSSKG